MKKFLLSAFCLIAATVSGFAAEAILFHEFTVDGEKVLKKVRLHNRIEYDYEGNMIRDYLPSDSDFSYGYDEKGRLAKVVYVYSFQSDKGLYWYEYDVHKNKSELKIADFEEINYFYDDKTDLCIRKTDTGNGDEEYEYDENGRMTKFVHEYLGDSFYRYDEYGKMIWSRNNVGTESFYGYDSFDRLISETCVGPNLLYETSYDYDGQKFIEVETSVKISGDIKRSNYKETREYNSSGLLIHSVRDTDYWDGGKSRKENFYRYDETGLLQNYTKIVDGKKTDFYCEFFYWDNGLVNTVNVYEELDTYNVAGKSYVYEKEGIGGPFEIDFNEDGTYVYEEGFLSSYIGFGKWTVDGDTLVMADDSAFGNASRVNRFKISADRLIFQEQGSTSFLYVDVADGECFLIKPDEKSYADE